MSRSPLFILSLKQPTLRVMIFMLCCGCTASFGQTVSNIDDQALPKLSKTKVFESPPRTPSRFPQNGETKWLSSYRLGFPSKFLRLHLELKQVPVTSTWYLQILDQRNLEIQRITVDSFKKGKTGILETWSEQIPGNAFLVKLIDSGNPEGLNLLIDKFNYHSREPAEKAVVGADERQDLGAAYPLDFKYNLWGRKIAAVFFQELETGTETNCTGVFLTPTLFMTNNHCISDPSQLDNARIWTNYLTNQTKQTMNLTEIAYTDRQLDFSVLRLKGAVSKAEVAEADFINPKEGMSLILIQHPDERAKMIAVKGCKLEKVRVPDRPTDFFHICDSQGGSSGSPLMLEGSGKVIGLHHLGRFNPQKKDFHNLGVKILDIIKNIQQSKPLLYQEMINENSSLKIIQQEGK